MRFGGGGLQFLMHARVLLAGFLIAVMLGLAFQMLATFNARTRDLAGQPRWKLLTYWGLALAVVLVIFLRLVIH